jgi:hypothetical protein
VRIGYRKQPARSTCATFPAYPYHRFPDVAAMGVSPPQKHEYSAMKGLSLSSSRRYLHVK